jgi:HSP20 family protein
MMRISHDPFEHFFAPLFSAGPARMARVREPVARRATRQAQLLRSEEGWELRADLPGVPADAIDLQVSDHEISISVAGPSAPEGMQAVFVERPSGAFERRWRLRESLDTDAADVEYTDGFLTVKFKPRRASDPRKIVVSNPKRRETESPKQG